MSIERSVTQFLGMLTVGANLFVLAVIVLWVAARAAAGAAAALAWIRASVGPVGIAGAWMVAVVATAGSLFYSEGAGFIPCTLCWYQRIAMYPLVLLLGIAVLRRDRLVARYAVPLASAGALISIYHYQLQRFPSQASAACSVEAPCTITWVWRFGFISIPFMALSAFALIVVLLVLARRAQDEPTAEQSVRELEEARRKT